MQESAEEKEFRSLAGKIRVGVIEQLRAFGQGHIGGAMSIADTLAVLYGGVMFVDPKNPANPKRDRLVLSKGHAGPALYAALCERGFFPREWLGTLNQGGTHLPSHCDRTKTPGVDVTTGSLGQGASVAAGLALGAKLRGEDYTTYLIVGDGECNEGQVWEAVMFAAHHKLGNLVAFVDWNKQQLDGYTENVMANGSFEEKLRAFGWNAVTVNGHDTAAIFAAITAAKEDTNKPSAIILDTVKGKGAFFAEGVEFNHSMSVSGEQAERAIAEITEAAR
ncbi:MAG: transketolase [Oscillospiraceae bacterium]|jgi:transketolase|nr:transketolase [Oscillospiraceae bacterium]